GIHGESFSATAAAVAGFNLNSGPGVYGKSVSGSAIHADGNATQAQDKGGFVKAMAYISGNGTVIRCYNSQRPASEVSTVPCGINCRISTTGKYIVNFGFPVRNRFAMVIADGVE